MAQHSNQTQSLDFWRTRIKQAKDAGLPIDFAMAASGFDWGVIDKEHSSRIFKYATRNSKILDVGCGYGRTAHWFADENYTGIDFVSEFVDEAHKRHPNKRFLVGNITEALPFKDKEFDIALLISVKRVIAPVVGEKVWGVVEKELKRVAKKVIILEYGMSRPKDIEESFEVL